MRRTGSSRGTVRAWTSIGIAAVSIAACVAVLLPGAKAHAEPVPGEQWKVVVHPSNPIRTMPREELERIYRRRSRFWTDGTSILPLNLPGGDPVRKSFSEQVLRDDEEDLTVFWNRQYFQGTSPPAVLQSSKAVRAYVAATANAIGYIAAADVDASVAVVEVSHAD